MKRIAILTALTTTMVASNAFADTSQFTGFSAQLGVGYMHNTVDAATVYDVVDGGTNGETLNSAEGSQGIGKFGFGYTFPMSDQWTLGIGLDINPFSSTIGTATAVGGSVTSKQSSSYAVSLQPAFMLDGVSSIYGKIGYSETKVSNDTVNNNTYNGYLVGIGYKRFMAKNVYMYAETDYAPYGSERIVALAEVYADRKLTSYDIVVGVGYKF